MAELDEAVAKERGEASAVPSSNAEQPQGAVRKCPRCKSSMQGNACPTCGYKIYQPMSEEKRKKIRWITTAVCLVVFLVLFWLLQKKG